MAVTSERPEELVAQMGLLEVETAADLAAAAVAARPGCKGQCVSCTLFGCIDSLKTGFVTEGQTCSRRAVRRPLPFAGLGACSLTRPRPVVTLSALKLMLQGPGGQSEPATLGFPPLRWFSMVPLPLMLLQLM